ncbi:heterokaryon incompatibility protein-domain-containing protein [Xylaria sp. CBS 124048]|nr:heterokaryon incompatibility protein-domain-containing protein [Xylaria sp. CBS 124048]
MFVMNVLYEPLPTSSASESHIRLLTLLPAKSEADPIRCKLDIVSLASRPIYEALSYCWTPANPQHLIECNGSLFNIGENLNSALRHLRCVEIERRLWIDAICINQDDLSEKGDQVLLMREIYRGSQCVLVWLGPATHDTGLAFGTLLRLSSYWDEISERWTVDKLSVLKLGPFRDTLRQLLGTDIGRQKDIEDDQRFALQPPETAALQNILGRSWWRRTWVIQEVCLAKQVVMICGSETLSWEDVAHGYLVAVGPGGLLTTIGASEEIDCCWRMYQLKTMFQDVQHQKETLEAPPSTDVVPSGQTVLDLLTLVQMSSKHETTRLHDRIYGVLGLATLHPTMQPSAKKGPSIVPDYTTTAKECFQKAAIAMMMDAGNLDVLSDPSYRLKAGVDLPSWMPNWGYNPFESSENKAWESPTPFTPFVSIAALSTLFRQEAPKLSACGESSQCEPRFIDDSILVVEGHIVDTVATISPALDGKLEDESEERWAQYANQHSGQSFFQIPGLIIQILVRVATFAESLLGWEELAFANPARPTRAEQECHIRVLLSDRMFQNVDVSIAIYQREWSPLLGWLRWLTPLKMLGARPGAPTPYNLIAGVVLLVGLTLSRTKSHLVTIARAMESRMARTDAGRLAKLPGAARIGDKIILLKGSKYPVVVRPTMQRWEFVGCCFVDGIMYGEAWHSELVREMEFV